MLRPRNFFALVGFMLETLSRPTMHSTQQREAVESGYVSPRLAVCNLLDSLLRDAKVFCYSWRTLLIQQTTLNDQNLLHGQLSSSLS